MAGLGGEECNWGVGKCAINIRPIWTLGAANHHAATAFAADQAVFPLLRWGRAILPTELYGIGLHSCNCSRLSAERSVFFNAC